MLCNNKSYLGLLVILTLLWKAECRKTKKNKITYQPPALINYPNTTLPSDSQVTVFLQESENKTFHFLSSIRNTPLSITIIACTSPIYWSLKFSNSEMYNKMSSTIDTYNFQTVPGLYTLALYAEKAAFVNIYITRTVELPSQILNESKNEHLKLLKRRKRRKLTARWDQSLLDPYATTYCLVINTRKSYSTLCSAQYEINTPFYQDSNVLHEYQVTTRSIYQGGRKGAMEIPNLICIGNKTHYTLSNLQQDINYYFNIFAINGHTNLTYLHGSAVMKLDSGPKSIFLKDGKLTSANLKKLDGKAFFTYKVEKKVDNSLRVFIIPCGGAVDVILKYKAHRSKKRIKRFGKMEIKNPSLATKYQLNVLSFNHYGLEKTQAIKILVTTRNSKILFPNLPSETVVHEYVSLRKCDSVTVGWYAAPTDPNIKYCIAAKKGKLSENGDNKVPDNCRIDYEMKTMMNVSYCKHFSENSGEIIIERIENLNPGETYIIYVTIKKEEGKSLSYDLLQVHTRPECD